MTEFLTTNDVAKILGKASATVLYHERLGKLRALRTAGGLRLFTREEVERFAAQQRTRKAKKQQ
jgi:excisionase family DNA binding protein